MSKRARDLLDRVRRRPNVPPAHRLATPRAYTIVSVSLYAEQIEYLNRLADALKRHKNEPRNRSGAIQWLIEEHMKAELGHERARG